MYVVYVNGVRGEFVGMGFTHRTPMFAVLKRRDGSSCLVKHVVARADGTFLASKA